MSAESPQEVHRRYKQIPENVFVIRQSGSKTFRGSLIKESDKKMGQRILIFCIFKIQILIGK